jgi:hypothetical protein
MTVKIRKNSKPRVWTFYGEAGANVFLGDLTYYKEEVLAFFPGCRIVGSCVFL